jgi:putative flippase GtrA
MKQLLLQKKQFLLYCVIGSVGSTLDFSIYSQLVHSGWLNYQAANAIGYASGTVLSFVLNAWFNFRITDRIAVRLARFFGVGMLGWLVSAGLLHLLIGTWGLNKYAAKLAALLVIVLLQYNLNRLVSFRKAA